MITSNIPLTYAVKVNNTIHLYVLIYAGSDAPDFPTQEAVDDVGAGNTILIDISKGNIGTTKYFEHYTFVDDSYTDIKVLCDGHVRQIEIEDLDNAAVPSQSGDQALDVPYAYTQKININSFKVELVIFSAPNTPKRFRCTHTGPNIFTNTNSAIDTNGSNATSEFQDFHTFTVTNFYATTGAHEVSISGPPNRKSKTKNRNHSQQPFPPPQKRKVL